LGSTKDLGRIDDAFPENTHTQTTQRHMKGANKTLLYVGLLALASLSHASQPLVFPPVTNSSALPDVALIWIQGALVPNERYVPLMNKIQQTCSALRIWVGLPSLPLNTPTPVTIGPGVDDVLKMLAQQGMGNSTVNFYGAHSLGTVMLQDYIVGQPDKHVAAQILGGGYILRKRYYPSFSYPYPTLTIGGELDGLARVTRTIAESIYNILNVTSPSSPITSRGSINDVTPSTFPVIMVPGMNHWQFASGEQTSWVRTHDLVSEISDDDAYTAVASNVCFYLQYITALNQLKNLKQGMKEESLLSGLAPKIPTARQRLRTVSEKILVDSQESLEQAVRDTRDFIVPVVQEYMREGSRHYNAKDQFGGDGEKTCVKGLCDGVCEWAKVAQTVIAGDAPGYTTVSPSNYYVKLSSSPVDGGEFHLPHIFPNNVTLVVNITTYAEGSWDKEDGLDNGIAFTSASELSAKLVSRQCVLINSTGNASVPFSVDDPNFCSITNQQAYSDALSTAGEKTRQRFLAIGVPFLFGDDIGKDGGPSFIDSPLQFNSVADNSSVTGKAVQVVAPMCKTEVDYWKKHFPFPRPSWIPDPGCYHYCKLLSPARAMEWIYVDGLRASASNSSQCTNCISDLTKEWCWIDGACYDPADAKNPCVGDSGKSWCVSEDTSKGECACSSCWDPLCAHDSVLSTILGLFL